MQEIIKYDHCFICGDLNPLGLQARFFYDGEFATTTVVASGQREGYYGILHGGIIGSLLDEVMVKVLLAEEIYAVTAEMTVKYHRPIPTGTRLTVRGRKTGQRRRLYHTEAMAEDEAGTIYASATGKCIEVTGELRAQLTQSIAT